MDIELPKPPAALAHLDAMAKYPEAPIVVLHWLDASFSSSEEIFGREVPKGYRPGCVDCMVAFFLGVEDGCVVLAESVYVREDQTAKYRHIWNIPVGMVIRVDELQPKPAASRETPGCPLQETP